MLCKGNNQLDQQCSRNAQRGLGLIIEDLIILHFYYYVFNYFGYIFL